MSRKMNYGPRFGQTIVTPAALHDWRVSNDMRSKSKRIAAVLKAAPLYKREMWAERAANAAHKRRIPREERFASEDRMIEAVRKAVEMLSFAMIDLMSHRAIPGEVRCNQLAIHNAIVMLRTKCGVHFDGNEFTERVPLDPRPIEPISSEAEVEWKNLVKHQRKMRQLQFERMTERLIARNQSTEKP